MESVLDRFLADPRQLRSAFARALLPEPELTVTEWADKYFYLAGESSSEPGKFRSSRTPYLRGVMDCLSTSNPARRIVFEKGTQLGATTAGNAWIGYGIHHSPGPMLFVQPTVDMAKAESKQRLGPVIEETPVLRELVAPARSRDSGNTILVKRFPGGILMMAGANSAKGLRRAPAGKIFMDEIDGYPQVVGGARKEGDPVAIAEKRASNFPRKKIFLVSTPTIKGLSRIDKEYQDSDRRRYFVPCPHCGNFDWIRWENIRWVKEEDAETGKGIHRPETAALMCLKCGVLVEERYKTWMLEHGEWRATAASKFGTIGFHLSALYSPLGWLSWKDCVLDWLKAQNDPDQLQVFINTVLGEAYEDRSGEAVNADSLLARREQYPAEVPNGVGVLLGAIDVQLDRFEVSVIGFGAGQESWLIASTQIPGDPDKEATQLALDEFRRQKFRHQSGREITVDLWVMDTRYKSDAAYAYCASRASERVVGIRGVKQVGHPLVIGLSKKKTRYGARIWNLCTDTGKDTLTSRLKIKSPGPGYMHLPEWVEQEYVDQLLSERAIWKYEPGKGRFRKWVKVRAENHAWDLAVYCLAGLRILGAGVIKSLPERAAKLAAPPEPAPTEPPRPDPLRPAAPLSGMRPWKVSGWRW